MVQVVNLQARPEGPVVWEKCLRRQLSGRGECLIHKGVHRCGERGSVDFVVTEIGRPEPKALAQSLPLLSLKAAFLTEQMNRAGMGHVEVYGGYGRKLFDAATSGDLVVVGRKSPS